jgi:serine/threonine protein kinase
MNEESLFNLVVNADDTERGQLLDQHCGDDAELRQRVEQLVHAYHDRETAGIAPTELHGLAAEAAEPETGRTSKTSPENLAGTVLADKYTLLEVIGQGGMGSVWLASQSTPVKRKVAIKLIKAGMDSRAVLARFEQERQALAIMDHPNIAKVLDGGLMPGGQPYFVMELVKGLPITEYCDRMKLSPEKRLELFIPVCNAIQHAHQKGIIHRDIKPSNVLVALFDDTPVPKVIDFGVAKATGASLSEETIHTAFGGVVGTPQYMSPEQATLNNLDIDTRSDVYSLGVLLYELLTGSPPFSDKELEKIGVLEILRVVREVDPPRPSVKLSSSHILPALSANRSTEPGKLTNLLRSELDWIVLRALEKERSRRYETAQSFAADVMRYLAGDQVLAHPPTLGYRFRKFAKKHRGLLTAGTLVAAALLAGIVGTSWQMFRANREAERANSEMRNAQVARDEAEVALINGILRPLGYNDKEINPSELQSFEDLAYHANDRIKLRTLEICLEDPALAARVYSRVERLIQACVGVSLQRHEQAIQLCLAKARDLNADTRIRGLALLGLVELGAEEQLPLSEALDITAADGGPKFAWPRISAAYASTSPKDWIEACWQIVERGENLTSLASQPIIAEATRDRAFAEAALTRIQSAVKKNSQLDHSQSTKAVIARDEMLATYLAISSSLYADDPNGLIESYCGLWESVDWAQLNVSDSKRKFSTAPRFFEELLYALSEADEPAFNKGLNLLSNGDVTSKSDFLIEALGSITVGYFSWNVEKKLTFELSPRMPQDQASKWYRFFLILLDLPNSVFSEYAFRGVVLSEIGPHLRSGDADRYFQLLRTLDSDDKQSFGFSPEKEAANRLQAIAGLMRSPDFTRHEEAANWILELSTTNMYFYARSSGWRSIGESAEKLNSDTIKQAFAAIISDALEPSNLALPEDYFYYTEERFGNLKAEDAADDYGTLIHAKALCSLIEVQPSLESELSAACLASLDMWLQSEGKKVRQAVFLRGVLSAVSGTIANQMAQRILNELPTWTSDFQGVSEKNYFAALHQLLSELEVRLDPIEKRKFQQMLLAAAQAPPTSDYIIRPALLTSLLNSDDLSDTDRLLVLTQVAENYVAYYDHYDYMTNFYWEVFKDSDLSLSDREVLLREVEKIIQSRESFDRVIGCMELLKHADLSASQLPADLLREVWNTRLVIPLVELPASDIREINNTRKRIWEPCLAFTLARKETDLPALLADIEQHVKNCETTYVFEFFVELISEAKIELSAATVDLMATKANELFRASPSAGKWLISFVDDGTLLAEELQKPTCFGDFRSTILQRLEQLAFPESLQNLPDNPTWDPELYGADLAAPAEKFLTVADFVRWDQNRAANDRWLLVTSRDASKAQY